MTRRPRLMALCPLATDLWLDCYLRKCPLHSYLFYYLICLIFFLCVETDWWLSWTFQLTLTAFTIAGVIILFFGKFLMGIEQELPAMTKRWRTVRFIGINRPISSTWISEALFWEPHLSQRLEPIQRQRSNQIKSNWNGLNEINEPS